MITFENVGFRYGDGPEVLRDVSLRLDSGSFHFLTGASGAGKSSFLRLLYLDARATRGRLSLFGGDAANLNRDDVALLRRRIGVVFQDFRLLDHLSAAENVALPLTVSGKSPETYAADVSEMLEWVGLGPRKDARPPELSGGEKQRVAIARAVITQPDLLLADEPTGSVDPEMGERIMGLFQEMNRNSNTTVVIATHDRALTERYGFPALTMSDGLVGLRQPAPFAPPPMAPPPPPPAAPPPVRPDVFAPAFDAEPGDDQPESPQ